jgi:HK97 family phage portal protein
MGVGSFFSSFNPFQRSQERRSYTSQIFGLKGNFLGLLSSNNSSGVYLSPSQAMRISAVYTCVSVRSDAVSMLPANIFQRNGNNKDIAYKHPGYNAVHNRPNPWQTSTQFWALVIQKIDLLGDCYTLITREKGSIRLDILCNEDVSVNCGKDGNPYYNVNGNPVDYSNILHFKSYSRDGKRGLSKIQEHQETIGSAKKQREYANRSLNVIPPFYLSTPGQTNIKDEGVKSIKDRIKDQSKGYFDEGSLPILTNGMKIETVGLKPVDAAYLEQISATKEDIFGIFRVPPALANSYKSGVTYNNLEQQSLQFLIYTLSPLLKNIEEEVNEKLFLTKEQGVFYMKFNVNALLRTDLATKSEWLTSMFKIGVYSRNEMREIEDLNPLPGGDKYYIEGNNMTALDKEGNVVLSAAPTAQATTPKLSEDVKKRLKEKFNGHSADIINFFEQ